MHLAHDRGESSFRGHQNRRLSEEAGSRRLTGAHGGQLAAAALIGLRWILFAAASACRVCGALCPFDFCPGSHQTPPGFAASLLPPPAEPRAGFQFVVDTRATLEITAADFGRRRLSSGLLQIRGLIYERPQTLAGAGAAAAAKLS